MKAMDTGASRYAISSELVWLEANNTFEFVSPAKTPRTPNILISMQMILQKELDERREFKCNKAKLVAHDFRQQPGIDFGNTSASLVSIAAEHLTLTVIGSHMTTKHLDVPTAFVETKVNEKIYVTLSEEVVLLEGRL